MNADEVLANYQKHLQRGQLLMDVARWREALHEFNQHLSSHPDNYTALCQSALCHLNLKEYQRAYDITKNAIKVSPESEWAYRLQSAIFTENGEPKRALDAAKLCVEKAPYNFDSIHSLFWAEANYGNCDEAEKTLALLTEIMPASSTSHEAAGYLALKRKKHEHAEKHYLEALKLDPESINALNNLGVVYLHYAQTGKGRRYKQKSIEMFERAVKLQPTFKRGQQNITTASKALKFGLPAGGFFLVWMGIRLLSLFLGSFTDQTTPTYTRIARPNQANPLSSSIPNYLLTGTNIYFIVIAVGSVVALLLLLTRFREAILYQLFTLRGWAYILAAFGGALGLYVYALWFLGTDGTPLSGFGMGVSFLVTLISGINLFRLWSQRRAIS